MPGIPVVVAAAPAAVPATSEELRSWLSKRICHYLDRSGDPIAIDGTMQLGQYGLDSVYAFALCGDIEERLRIDFDPALIWVHNTLDALTRYLSDRLSIAVPIANA